MLFPVPSAKNKESLRFISLNKESLSFNQHSSERPTRGFP